MLWLLHRVGLIPGPDTCDMQCLGQELHWWHYSQKCVGHVSPPQLPYQIQQKNLIAIFLVLPILEMAKLLAY